MIVITGGAGFIGSRLVAGLNNEGRQDIIVVDNLENGNKFFNLVGMDIADYFDKNEFREMVRDRSPECKQITAIFHQGACSVTTEWDGRYVLDNNFTYSKELLHLALEREIPFIYASSAAVYGLSKSFAEIPAHESPANVYGYSKLLFDNYVRRHLKDANSQVVGLRYFNVYGPGEAHKGSMASVIYHFNNQIRENGELKLFEGAHGYGNGEQLRDFVYIDDVVAVNLWVHNLPQITGIYNVGTGKARSFNDVAKEVIKWHGKGEYRYIPFPEKLLNTYQNYTQADLKRLISAGHKRSFTPLEQGVQDYLHKLNAIQP